MKESRSVLPGEWGIEIDGEKLEGEIPKEHEDTLRIKNICILSLLQ